MGRKAVLTAEERKQHRQESAKKWYQAHKAKNAAGKPRKAKPAKKAAKHAVNEKASTKKPAAKPRKALAANKGVERIKAKIAKLREKHDAIVVQVKTLKEELKALKAAK